MNRNDVLHWFILGVGLLGSHEDLGCPTSLLQLWQEAKEKCFDCTREEILDALYTLPREQASLIKFVSVGEGSHPVSFERIRNTVDWPDYFASDIFSIKVLAEGRSRYHELTELLDDPHVAKSLGVDKIHHVAARSAFPQ